MAGVPGRRAIEVRIIKSLAFVLFLAAGLPGLVFAGKPAAQGAPGIDAPLAESQQNFETYSDQELTSLAAQWDVLSTHQRRALLTEMKGRMASGGNAGPAMQIRSERRYGRIVRQPDGRVIRIETNVVRVRPVTPEMLARARAQAGFGVGFEQRVSGIERRQISEPPSGTTIIFTDDTATSIPMPVFKASDSGP